MRIGIDARELAGHPTGVGRYLMELLARWRQDASESHEFLLYLPESADLERLETLGCAGTGEPANQRLEGAQDQPAPREAGGVVELARGGSRLRMRPVAGHGDGTWWEQTHLPRALRQDEPDVLFAPAYSAPLRARMPVVLTIHDVSFAAHPEWFPWREGLRRRWLARLSAGRAAVVLTDSEFSRREIADHLGTPPGRIRVIPPGISSPGGAEALFPRAQRPPLVLFAGTLFSRRRLPLLIRAFARVRRRLPDARLAIVGENRTYPRQDPAELAADAGVADSVTIAAYVDEARLARLYGAAQVFAFLSEYEGFGLTPLEALAAGVPIVVLDTPVAREVYSEAAWFVPPDERAVASALEALLVDPAEAQALLSRAPAVLARYSWDRAAHETLDALLRAGESRRAREG